MMTPTLLQSQMKAVACVRALAYALGRTNKWANFISLVLRLEDSMGFTTIDTARELSGPKLCCIHPCRVVLVVTRLYGPMYSLLLQTLLITMVFLTSGIKDRPRLDEEEAAQNGRRSSRGFDWPSDTVASKMTPPPPVDSACLCPTQLAEGNLVPPRLRRRVSAVHKPPRSVPYAGARQFPAPLRRRVAALRSRGRDDPS